MNNRYKNNIYIENRFDDSLSEGQILDYASVIETKRMIAKQISEGMSSLHLNKTTMALKMHSSRPSLDRLLDEKDTRLTLTTLVYAATALGKKIKIELVSEQKMNDFD